jgi:hypothetical protein
MHNHVDDLMEDYMSGHMDAPAAREFRLHLGTCRSCSAAYEDLQQANSYLQRLRPIETPPQPGPEFYAKLQASIDKKLDTSWFGNFALTFQAPRLAFPILFLFLGLVVSAWTMMATSEWEAEGIMGIPPRRFSQTITSQTDRDMVMVSLVDEIESQ